MTTTTNTLSTLDAADLGGVTGGSLDTRAGAGLGLGRPTLPAIPTPREPDKTIPLGPFLPPTPRNDLA